MLVPSKVIAPVVVIFVDASKTPLLVPPLTGTVPVMLRAPLPIEMIPPFILIP